MKLWASKNLSKWTRWATRAKMGCGSYSSNSHKISTAWNFDLKLGDFWLHSHRGTFGTNLSKIWNGAHESTSWVRIRKCLQNWVLGNLWKEKAFLIAKVYKMNRTKDFRSELCSTCVDQWAANVVIDSSSPFQTQLCGVYYDNNIYVPIPWKL